jgi:hypothetical protein
MIQDESLFSVCLASLIVRDLVQRTIDDMASFLSAVFPILLVLITSAFGQNLVATLDYGSFKGSYSATYNIAYWRKIPFAAPPIGENRFRAPQPPNPITSGTYDSNQAFDMCPQRTVGCPTLPKELSNTTCRSTAQRTASISACTLVLGFPPSASVQLL